MRSRASSSSLSMHSSWKSAPLAEVCAHSVVPLRGALQTTHPGLGDRVAEVELQLRCLVHVELGVLPCLQQLAPRCRVSGAATAPTAKAWQRGHPSPALTGGQRVGAALRVLRDGGRGDAAGVVGLVPGPLARPHAVLVRELVHATAQEGALFDGRPVRDLRRLGTIAGLAFLSGESDSEIARRSPPRHCEAKGGAVGGCKGRGRGVEADVRGGHPTEVMPEAFSSSRRIVFTHAMVLRRSLACRAEQGTVGGRGMRMRARACGHVRRQA